MTRVMTDEQRKRKADYMRKSMRGYTPKPREKTTGYGHKPGKRADRFIDREGPLPSEDVILHYWSHWDIVVELNRLNETKFERKQE